jgi:hypothetical protein
MTARLAFSFILSTALAQAGQSVPTKLWVDATADTIGATQEWTNKVEIADLNEDGRPDLLFANGGNYSEPGTPEPSRVFFNMGPGQKFVEKTTEVFGPSGDLSRAIKARDLTGDGIIDIVMSTTYQRQSRLFVGLGKGAFKEVTATHLPKMPLSVGDLEAGDADGDGDLDLVLADWGPGNNMTNEGGRTRLWLNDGEGRFTDATDKRMPATLVRFSWDIEFVDVDNDYDLDILVSCKRCPGSLMFRNDGTGTFTESGGIPAYTNNYEFEAMDLDGDGFLDLVTQNDGEIVKGVGSSRREHVFRNDGKGRFRDVTTEWWPDDANIGEDDNVVAFLDFDSDGDADFLIGSLSGPDRLLINDGKGNLTLARDVFEGPPTPGTLGLALADLDADGKMDVVQAQGENPKAVEERVFKGTGLNPDKAPPVITMVGKADAPEGRLLVRARVHDRKSPVLPTEFKRVIVELILKGEQMPAMRQMTWYGEYLWRADIPAAPDKVASYRVCATDARGNTTCVDGK